MKRKGCSKSADPYFGGTNPIWGSLKRKKLAEFQRVSILLSAERQGFEPWDPARGQRFSRPPRSTTPAPFLGFCGAKVESFFELCKFFGMIFHQMFKCPEAACEGTPFNGLIVGFFDFLFRRLRFFCYFCTYDYLTSQFRPDTEQHICHACGLPQLCRV